MAIRLIDSVRNMWLRRKWVFTFSEEIDTGVCPCCWRLDVVVTRYFIGIDSAFLWHLLAISSPIYNSHCDLCPSHKSALFMATWLSALFASAFSSTNPSIRPPLAPGKRRRSNWKDGAQRAVNLLMSSKRCSREFGGDEAIQTGRRSWSFKGF